MTLQSADVAGNGPSAKHGSDTASSTNIQVFMMHSCPLLTLFPGYASLAQPALVFLSELLLLRDQ
jgi:hypothetical protein